MNTLAIRLYPGDDLKQSLLHYCEQNAINAGCILSCVGSLTYAKIRFANQATSTTLDGKLEILALSGTLSQHGVHLHIAVSDQDGHVIGGHLMENSHIYTTGEIIVGVFPEYLFRRELDEKTGYPELKILSNERE